MLRAHPPRSTPASLARDIALLGFFWGASVMFQRLGVSELEPVALVTLRVAAAVAFFVPFAPRVVRALARSPRTVADTLLMGVLNPGASGVLSALALTHASTGVAAVIMSTSPIFTALAGRFVLDEPPLTRRQFGGMVLAFGGVAVLVVTRTSGVVGADGSDPRGIFYSLAVVVVTSVAVIWSRRRLMGFDPIAAAGGQNVGGLLAIGGVAIGIGQPIPVAELTPILWVAIVFSGTIGLGLAFALYVAMIQRHGTVPSMMAMYAMPVVAAVLGAVVLGEMITLSMLAGGALVLGGVIVFTTSRSRAVRRQPR